jgi:SAM-dependent methyltransferase
VTNAARAYAALFEGMARMGPGTDAISESIAAWAGAGTAQRILEVGAGHGATARVLRARAPHAHLIATDKNATFAERARAALGAASRTSVCVADLLRLPFPPDSMDAVVAEGCVFATGLRRSLAPLRSVLRVGGRLALTHFGWTRTRVPTPMRKLVEDGLPERFVRGEAYMVLLEHEGFRALHLEPFPRAAWVQYYDALRARVDTLEGSGIVPQEMLDSSREEIRMFDDGGLDYYAYFLIAGERVR